MHGALVRLTSSSTKNPRLVWRAARACAVKPALSSRSVSWFERKAPSKHSSRRCVVSALTYESAGQVPEEETVMQSTNGPRRGRLAA